MLMEKIITDTIELLLHGEQLEDIKDICQDNHGIELPSQLFDDVHKIIEDDLNLLQHYLDSIMQDYIIESIVDTMWDDYGYEFSQLMEKYQARIIVDDVSKSL